MSFEKPTLSPQEIEEQLPTPNEEVLHMKNDLQTQLIMRSHDGRTDLDEHFKKWIDENYLKFRIVFNELRYTHPDLLEEYKDDCENLLALIDNKMSSIENIEGEADPFMAAA